MSDKEQTYIFQRNLLYYLAKYEKTQLEVANAIGVSHQTFSTWCRGIALPRMGKIQLLADYFHINKSDLIEEHDPAAQENEKESSSGTKYYFSDETAAVAQEIFENPDLRALFDAAMDVDPKDLQMAAEMLKRFKETNPNG